MTRAVANRYLNRKFILEQADDEAFTYSLLPNRFHGDFELGLSKLRKGFLGQEICLIVCLFGGHVDARTPSVLYQLNVDIGALISTGMMPKFFLVYTFEWGCDLWAA